MIKLFKTNGLMQIVFIVFAGLILWTPSLINPPTPTTDISSGPLYVVFCFLLAKIPLVATIVALLLTLTEGYLLTKLLNDKGLIPLNTLLPMFLYVLAMGFGVSQQGFSHGVVTNLWIILALHSMMPDEHLVVPENRIFNTSLWLSMSTITYLPCIFLSIPVIIGLLSYKVYKAREWGIAILGLLAPYIIVGTVLFMTDDLTLIDDYIKEAVNAIDFNIQWVGWSNIYSILVGLFFVVLGMFSIANFGTQTIAQRRHGWVVIGITIYGICTTFYDGFTPVNGQHFAIVASTIGCILLDTPRPKRIWINDLCLVFIIIAGLYSYYAPLFD